MIARLRDVFAAGENVLVEVWSEEIYVDGSLAKVNDAAQTVSLFQWACK